ncbi:hypothetical protein MUN81_13585 [Hymenobacter sp. 5317J-9]|uniref:hypothetical protein n=1 Tax=Hymenobacter sp. 5317J-9 TaxID=2932250 RepID=UPI001FD661C5|nr:hypothetical protein [Hymenobacter sp. 5317J-9]UOQ96280.1 hypothetical protein MUN81_13585 [Hymenobacter sp. 5317J-9]
MKSPHLLSAFSIVALTGAGTLLSGCGDKCAGVYCSPCNAFIDDIIVYIDVDSLHGGFRRADLAGGYAVRYVAPGFARPIDTVRQVRGGTNFYNGGVTLRSLPWPAMVSVPAPSNLESYNFRFVLPATNRTYDLSDIELQIGESGGDGCCGCGQNTRRRFVLNGVPVVADGDGSGRGAVLQR